MKLILTGFTGCWFTERSEKGATAWIYLMTDGAYYRFKDKCAGIPDGNWKRWRWLKRTVEYSSKH